MQPTLHAPPIVRFIWDTQVFIGVVESLSFTYQLFTPEGIPLRAKPQPRAQGVPTVEVQLNDRPRESPDVDKTYTVRRGDTLSASRPPSTTTPPVARDRTRQRHQRSAHARARPCPERAAAHLRAPWPRFSPGCRTSATTRRASRVEVEGRELDPPRRATSSGLKVVMEHRCPRELRTHHEQLGRDEAQVQVQRHQPLRCRPHRSTSSWATPTSCCRWCGQIVTSLTPAFPESGPADASASAGRTA